MVRTVEGEDGGSESSEQLYSKPDPGYCPQKRWFPVKYYG